MCLGLTSFLQLAPQSRLSRKLAEPLSVVAKVAVESKSHMRGVLIRLRGLCALYGSEESDDYILVSPTVMKSDACGCFRWMGLVGALI